MSLSFKTVFVIVKDPLPWFSIMCPGVQLENPFIRTKFAFVSRDLNDNCLRGSLIVGAEQRIFLLWTGTTEKH